MDGYNRPQTSSEYFYNLDAYQASHHKLLSTCIYRMQFFEQTIKP